MKRILIACAALLTGAAHAADPFTGGDAEAGQAKAAVCAACHGADGNSTNPEWPSLAGQNANYLYQQLVAFKEGARSDAVMQGQVAALSDEDMRDLAAHFAGLDAAPRAASEESVETARPLWRGGDLERGITACTACHGPTGSGNAGAGYPRLAGQHAQYSAQQLRRYRDKERGIGVNGDMMQTTAAQLTDEEIDALASYIQGLAPVEQ